MTASATTKSLVNIDTELNMYENGSGKVWVNIDHEGRRVSSALVRPETLRDMVRFVSPAGSYTRTDEGAHIGPEGEADWHGLYLDENRRAEKAEQERDQARARLAEAAKEIREQGATIAELAVESRPLTPDAIESVLHDILPLTTEHLGADDIANIAFDLHAALTEPTRPEGAAELHQVLDAIYQDEPGITHRGNLADMLATYGVRVVNEERS